MTLNLVKNWDKYVYTGILCLNHVALGLTLTAISPVMVEMKEILNTSMASITLYSTFVSIGFQLGALSLFFMKYLNRQILLTAATTLISLSISMFPYSPNLIVLFILTTFLGFGSGVVNTVINIWLSELWQQNSAPILQIPGFTFGIGTILSPVILSPYLLNSHIINDSNNVSSTTTTTISPSKELNFEFERRQLLKTPFLIISYFQMIFPYLLGIMFLVKRYKPPLSKESSSTIDKNKNICENDLDKYQTKKLFDNQTKRVKVSAIVIFTAVLSTYCVCESAFLTYFDTYYQYSPLRLSMTESAKVIIAFSTSYTAFRFISILVAIKMSPQKMVSIHYLICCVGIVSLIFARHNYTIVWVANVLIGIGCSAIFPALYAMFSQYMTLTNNLGAIFMFSGSASNMLPPYLLGLFIENYSYSFIIYVSLFLGLSMILFIFIIYLIFKHQLIEKLNKSTQIY